MHFRLEAYLWILALLYNSTHKPSLALIAFASSACLDRSQQSRVEHWVGRLRRHRRVKNRSTTRYTLELFSIIYFHSNSNNSTSHTTTYSTYLPTTTTFTMGCGQSSPIEDTEAKKRWVVIRTILCIGSHALVVSKHILILDCLLSTSTSALSLYRNDMIEAQLKQDRQMSRSVLYTLLTISLTPSCHPPICSISLFLSLSRRDLQCIACLRYRRGAFVPRVSLCDADRSNA